MSRTFEQCHSLLCSYRPLLPQGWKISVRDRNTRDHDTQGHWRSVLRIALACRGRKLAIVVTDKASKDCLTNARDSRLHRGDGSSVIAYGALMRWAALSSASFVFCGSCVTS